MHDLKFSKFFKEGTEAAAGIPPMDIRSDKIRPIAAAFVDNVMRVSAAAYFPARVAFSVRRDQLWVDCAELELIGKLEPDYHKFLSWPCPAGLMEIVERLKTHYFAKYPDTKKESGDVATIGLNYIESLLGELHHPAVRVSVEAILKSVIIDSWTGIETLAPDLWTVGVNHGPAEVAQRVNVATSQEKPDANFVKNWGDKLKRDPRTDYAGALIEAGRVTFRKLDRIIHWYALAFKDRARELFQSTPDIYALSAFRNVLVHNRGKVDKDFLKQIQPVADLREIYQTEDEKVIVDGEIAARLRNATIEVGSGLIQLVDDAVSATG